MLLNYEHSGNGESVVILHGLMGSCENWRAIRDILSERYHVVCMDLPSHGRSPYAAHFDLRSIGDAVVETLGTLSEGKVFLVGHSLGGKVVMQMASDHADRLKGIVVVDISPRAIPPVHLFVLRACQQIDLAAAGCRGDLDEALSRFLPQKATRDFLLKNIVRDADGRFAWRVCLQVLIDNYRVVSDAVTLGIPYTGPSLFLAGGRSPFRLMADEALIRASFPSAQFSTIADAGHLVHFEQRDAFVRAIDGFLVCAREGADNFASPP